MSGQADLEQVAAQRFADALQMLEADGDPEIDAREDPELAAMLETAAALRGTLKAVAPDASYATRARATVLHAMKHAEARTAPRVPFYRRWRWNLLAPVASAAAAAAVTFAITLASGGGGATVVTTAPQPAPQPQFASARPAEAGGFEPARPPFVERGEPAVTSFVSRTFDEELVRLETALTEISERAQQGQIIEADLFRTVSESSAAVARHIATAPEDLSRDAVVGYFQAMASGQFAMNFARPAGGDRSALTAAQAVSDDGLMVAARFLAASQKPAD